MKKFLLNLGKTRWLLVVFLFLGISGFLLSPTGFFKPLKNIFFEISQPFSIVGNFAINKIVIFFDNLASLSSLAQENQKLIEENLELQSRISILKEVQHENEILKNELGFKITSKELKLMPANIISRPISGYLKTIVIDRGTKDGLKTGQAVVSSGFLAGTISEVMANTAEVALITDYNSLVPVILQDSRGTGLLRGGLGGLTVEDIPLNVTIKGGEEIITSGLGGDMPSGILVGKVDKITSGQGEIFQKVTVIAPVKIYYLEFVFVIL